MTFYQELQLSSAGSKQLIKNTTDKKEKRRHILIYNFKVYLVMTFCFALVTLYSMIFGSDNSVAGVVFLLALLVLRQADFGIRTHHGLLCIVGIFAILIVGPRVSNMVSPWAAFVINIGCIFTLMLLGCHNVIMYNHSTFVLGYLLLQGYDVTGRSYYLRVISLLVGMLICMAVFYKNQRKRPYRRHFLDIFREFNIRSARNWWYIKLTLVVSTALLIFSLLGLPRAMWAGIACMSVCLPFSSDIVERAKKRGPYNIVGCLISLYCITYFRHPCILISASLAELVLVTLQDTHGRQSSIPSAPSPSLPASLVRQERSLSESAPMSLVLFILYCSIRL